MTVLTTYHRPASMPVKAIEVTDSSGDVLLFREGQKLGERLCASITIAWTKETSAVLLDPADVERLRDALTEWLEGR